MPHAQISPKLSLSLFQAFYFVLQVAIAFLSTVPCTVVYRCIMYIYIYIFLYIVRIVSERLGMD